MPSRVRRGVRSLRKKAFRDCGAQLFRMFVQVRQKVAPLFFSAFAFRAFSGFA